jgi:hypothetical protein
MSGMPPPSRHCPNPFTGNSDVISALSNEAY